MKKTRYNRQYIASLAISTLVPLIKAYGKFEAGNARHPAHRVLEACDMKMLWVEELPFSFVANQAQSSLDIWIQGAGKVFSVRGMPMEIVGFRGGPWVDTLVEIALQRGISCVRVSPGEEGVNDVPVFGLARA